MKSRISVLVLLTFCLLSAVTFAESLQLQQIKEVIKQYQDAGIATPPVYVNLLKTMQEEEAKSGSQENYLGKNLSDMDCSDDISGSWKTDSGLTILELHVNGKGLIYSDDASGQYYSKASLNWRSTEDKFTIIYNYIRTYDAQTHDMQSESKPIDETVTCSYMGTLLNIGGKLYRR